MKTYPDKTLEILSYADETYSQLPQDAIIEAVTRVNNLGAGARYSPFRGGGMNHLDTRVMREGEPIKYRDEKLSARSQHDIARVYHEDSQHPVLIWRKGHGDVNIPYNENRLTKKHWMDVALIATGISLASSEDKLGVLDHEGRLYSGRSASQHLSLKLMDATFMTGKMPIVSRKIPTGSSFIMASDFLESKEEFNELKKHLNIVSGSGVTGAMYMVRDPVEVTFPFKKDTLFKGSDGQTVLRLKNPLINRQQYLELMKQREKDVIDLAKSLGFSLKFFTTDQEPLEMVLDIFGLSTNTPTNEYEYGLG